MPNELNTDLEFDPIAILKIWRENLALRQIQSQERAGALQNAIDASGLLNKGINPLDDMFKLENLNANIRQEIESKLGYSFETEEGVKPNPKNPSNWKQRTRAMQV